MDKIQDYYDLAALVENDLVMVCLLVQIANMKLNKQLLNDIENMKFSKIDFTCLLDLNHKTIKDLSNMLRCNLANEVIEEKIVKEEINLFNMEIICKN